MTGQVAEVELVSVIKHNSYLEYVFLSNNDLRLSAIVVLQALKESCKLKTVTMSDNFLTECIAVELLSVKKNPLITELWLCNNMLQGGLIDVAISCKSLTNLLALDLSHNNINPSNVVHLASVLANITSLEVLIFGSLILNVKESLYFDMFQFYCSSKQELILHNNNVNDNEMFEVVCLEMWRSRFAGRIKFVHFMKNYFPIFSLNLQMNLVDVKQKVSIILKQSEQKMLALDAKSMIISLSSIIKTLTVLDLEYSNITKEAAVKLATVLNCNNVLEQL